MKKKIKIILCVVAVLVFIVLALLVNKFLQDYNKSRLLFLPYGEKIKTIDSPNKETKLNIYYIEGGGIMENALRGEIETEERIYNIYFCYDKCNFKVKAKWLDNKNVKINGINLDISNETYRND